VTSAETIDNLNRLTETCLDGELGYETAARDVRNTQLQTVFSNYAKQRAEFARQLQAEVERLGGAATDSTSFTAALHRGWIGLKSALSGGEGAAIVAACETGDEAAVAAFEHVADMDLTGQTKSLVEKQWQKIQEAHTHMLRLKKDTGGAEFPKTESADAVDVEPVDAEPVDPAENNPAHRRVAGN
jgi:uncharacterized protein (TIGR02284 family)